MTARRVALGVVLGSLVLAGTSLAMNSAGASAVFRVRPDPRMCPSPLCGGFWVAQVNHPTTPCADGSSRAWCYVAGASLPVPVSSRVMLVRGRIVRTASSEIRPLDRLVASKAWLGATPTSWTGTVLLVSDTGIRCVRAPCFSLRTATVNTTRTATASGLDLSGVAATPALARKAQAALTRGGLLVAATVRRDVDGGRTIVATQFFLATS